MTTFSTFAILRARGFSNPDKQATAVVPHSFAGKRVALAAGRGPVTPASPGKSTTRPPGRREFFPRAQRQPATTGAVQGCWQWSGELAGPTGARR